jgi:molybdate transport system substrate-binding protein
MSGLLSSCLLAFFAHVLTIAAASDLSSVSPELTQAFVRRNPTISVKFVHGASAMLRQQIENGAPYDLFLSANASYVDDLAVKSRVLPRSVRVYALGRIAVIWKDGRRHPLRDLTTSPIQVVALPNPKLAPYGVAAEEALKYGGLWGAVQPKVTYGENVRQTLQFLESGNADVAITSDALLQGRSGAEVLPAEWHQPIVQKAAIIAKSNNVKEDQAFLDFLTGDEGQAILARFGFGQPKHSK